MTNDLELQFLAYQEQEQQYNIELKQQEEYYRISSIIEEYNDTVTYKNLHTKAYYVRWKDGIRTNGFLNFRINNLEHLLILRHIDDERREMD